MRDTSLSPVPPDMARSSVTKFSNALIFKYENNTKNYNQNIHSCLRFTNMSSRCSLNRQLKQQYYSHTTPQRGTRFKLWISWVKRHWYTNTSPRPRTLHIHKHNYLHEDPAYGFRILGLHCKFYILIVRVPARQNELQRYCLVCSSVAPQLYASLFHCCYGEVFQ